MDIQRVNAAVKIKMQLIKDETRRRETPRIVKLKVDLMRLKQDMSSAEYNEYLKRVTI